MATNSGLKIKFSGTTPKGMGTKPATLPIMLELQLETSTPLDMMNEMILDGFKVKRNDRANYHPEFMVGFPPKLLDITGKHVVGDLSLRSNENVIVHICRRETPLRPKRKAAEVAKSSFKDALKAQDAMIKRNLIKKKKVSTSKIRISGPGHRLSDGKDVSNTAKANNLSPKEIKTEEFRRTLSDHTTFYPSGKRNHLQPKRCHLVLKNKDDLSSFLVQAFNKGSGGEPFKQIRAVYKKALANMQEISQAQARVHAATIGQFFMAPVKSVEVDAGTMLGSTFNQIGGDDCVSHQITYGKEMSKTGWQYIDRVSVLPLDIIKSVIENAYTSKTDDDDDFDDDDDDDGNNNVIDTGKELLRPIAIAQTMPQLFWSVVSHCRPSSDSEYYLPVEDMLRQLLPHLDWSFLNRDGRQQLLSEQARENLRQQKMTKLNRDEWMLVTPTEDDENELIECISWDEEAKECNMARAYSTLMIRSKSEPCCLNWRQLAKTDAKYLYDKLIRECAESAIEPPSLKSVETWIMVARNLSIDEIVNEIVGTDENIFGLLEALHSNTPKDLITYWGRHPKLLLKTMGDHPKNDDDLFHDRYKEQDVRRWISRAKVAIKICPWLDDYYSQFNK